MAKASVLKFEFEVAGATRDECIESLDNIVRAVITSEGGEPWIVVSDSYEKVMINQQVALSGDPAGFIYTGKRQIVFAGPTKLIGTGSSYRDGFRPQADPDDEPKGLY